ncbi:MAG: hypothetical protein JXA77_06925 [Bacteroidales bacterium]|nr:hypothetical protein [Bacteroidales bacterium]MBN2819869.1 hypothetical protein [Bacteroidales bacterium]
MYKKLIFTFLIVILTVCVFSQEYNKDTLKYKINESAFHGGLGITPLYGSITVNYEIMLVERPNLVFKKRGFRAGTGIYQYYDDGSLNVVINYTCLTGAENNHFELGLGAAYMHFLTTSGRYIVPAPNIGYRFKKPEGKFVFRTGVGFPELIYLSFGYSLN